MKHPESEIPNVDPHAGNGADSVDGWGTEGGFVEDGSMDMPAIGIVALNKDADVVELNGAARELIDSVCDRDSDVSSRTGRMLPENVMDQARSVIKSGQGRVLDISSVSETASEQIRICAWPVGRTSDSIACVLTIEDVGGFVDMRRRMVDADRLAALGKSASNAAHELNNPLDGILRYINLAIRAVEQQGLEKPREYLVHARGGLMRMVHILSELLDSSRRAYAAVEMVRVEGLIEEALANLKVRMEAQRVKATRDYCRVHALAPSSDIYQVFFNICKNALDAMPNGGELTISTRIAGGMVAIGFQDTGSGFSDGEVEAMFKAFYTTKPKGEGTGLGLALCKDIVRRHCGYITAERAPGGGSIFTVWLPQTSARKSGF